MATPKRYDRIAFVASASPEAQAALAQLTKLYGNHDADDSDVVVALGGDGLMLQTLHRHMRSDKPIYGMHRITESSTRPLRSLNRRVPSFDALRFSVYPCMISLVQNVLDISSTLSNSVPFAINAPYKLPPLQPTMLSTSIPSSFNTRHNPTTAAHLIPPEPITSATLFLVFMPVTSGSILSYFQLFIPPTHL
jgi:hypothetical protein